MHIQNNCRITNTNQLICILLIISCIPNTLLRAQEWFQDGDYWLYEYSYGLTGTEGYCEIRVIGDTIVHGKNSKILHFRCEAYSLLFDNFEYQDYYRYAYEEDTDIFLSNEFGEFGKLFSSDLEPKDEYVFDRPFFYQGCNEQLVYELDSLTYFQFEGEDLFVQHVSTFDSVWNSSHSMQIYERIGALTGQILIGSSACFTDQAYYKLCQFKSKTDSISFSNEDCKTTAFPYTDPIWDIGTKWTYEFQPFFSSVSYLTNEIIDTTRINGLKLYVVESQPAYSGIKYFYYDNARVYNYSPEQNLLSLLYDFFEDRSYKTEYMPICDPYFPYDSLDTKEYTIRLDSVRQFLMPDNSTGNLLHVSPIDTLIIDNEISVLEDSPRSILKGIGFMEGSIHHTHDWELGGYICDDLTNFVGKLRCYEDANRSYNFVGFPCDSSWIISSVNAIPNQNIFLYPNPSSDQVSVFGLNKEVDYEVYSTMGHFLYSGRSVNRSIPIKEKGILLIKISIDGKNYVNKIVSF